MYQYICLQLNVHIIHFIYPLTGVQLNCCLRRSAIYRMAKNPPSSEKEIFRKNYDKFCNVLKHEDGLLPHLVEKGIISWDDLDEIKSKNTSEKGPTLLKHISGPLDIDHTQGFYGLLEIMINHGKVDTQEFARKIKYECLSNRGNVKYNMYIRIYSS